MYTRSAQKNIHMNMRKLIFFKVLSTKEKKDQRMILGDHYQDKEFLRYIYNDILSKDPTILNLLNELQVNL